MYKYNYFQRSTSSKFYPGTNAVIYVIDASDKKRVTSSAVELARAVGSAHIKDVPLLVFSNKTDRSGHLSTDDIIDALGLNEFSQSWCKFISAIDFGITLEH